MLELCKEGLLFKDLSEAVVLKWSHLQKQREVQTSVLSCTDVRVLLLILPDEEELSHGKVDAVNLGDEYGGYCLIECTSIQGQRSRHGDHCTRQLFLHVEIIFQAADRDRQSHNAGRKKHLRLSFNPVFA